MPRTPLLRSVLRQIRLAQKPQDLDSKDLGREKPIDTGRRAFLGQAGAMLAVAALAPSAFAAKLKRRIAIVGGGMAGLHCALILKDHGHVATVYEASPRLGGRMFSNTSTWDEKQVSEWCGELIDTGHETMHGLAKRFNLKLDDLISGQPPGSEDTFYFGGSYYPAKQFQIDIQPVLKLAEADLKAAKFPTTYKRSNKAGRALDAMSIRGWIESRVPGGMASKLGQLLDLAYATEYGADTTDQSSLNLVFLLAYQPEKGDTTVFGVSDEAFHIRGGNEQLPHAMAREIGNENILTSRRLTVLQKLKSGAYELTFSKPDGLEEKVEADQVVLALPFSVLREVDLRQAGFDKLKMRAIRELGDGRSAKTQLQFESRIWNSPGAWPGLGSGSTYSDTGYQSTWEVTRAQPGKSGVLNFFSGGSVAAAQKIVASGHPFTSTGNALARQDAEVALQGGETVFPGLTAAWKGRFTQSVPHLHPLMRGSYAYYRVGQYTAFGGYEGVTQGRVYFCGDHTSQDFQGFMEGAASEGVRAAKDVMKD